MVDGQVLMVYYSYFRLGYIKIKVLLVLRTIDLHFNSQYCLQVNLGRKKVLLEAGSSLMKIPMDNTKCRSVSASKSVFPTQFSSESRQIIPLSLLNRRINQSQGNGNHRTRRNRMRNYRSFRYDVFVHFGIYPGPRDFDRNWKVCRRT